MRSCVTHFNHSLLAKQHLAVIQQDLGLLAHSIIQAVPTRWNSTLHMLVRMLVQKRALNIYASEHGGFNSLSAEQWNIVSNLIETLSPVEEVTLEMSHYESSASCIIPSVKVLKMLLSSQGPSSHGIKTMRQEMLESLTRRFAKVEEVKCAVLACLLDSRYKAHAFSSDTTLSNAKGWLKEETESLQQDTQCEETQSDDSSTLSKRPRTEENQKKLIDEMYDSEVSMTLKLLCLTLKESFSSTFWNQWLIEGWASHLNGGNKMRKGSPFLLLCQESFFAPHLLRCPVRESSVKSEPFMKRNLAGLQGRMLKNSVFYTTT